MGRWFTSNPQKACGDQFVNTTIAYHECLCEFNYITQKRKMGILKFKHCALADEMRKQADFDMYKIIGFSCLVFVVVAIVLFCSFKWYQQTNKNPCDNCCSCFSCDGKKKKRRRRENGHCNGNVRGGSQDVQDSSAGFDENWVHDMNADVGSFHNNYLGNGHVEGQQGVGGKKKNTLCMKFCLSEPVQDCCEFFDCDLMWRKKNVYSQPYAGRNKKTQGGGGGGSGGGEGGSNNQGGELNSAYGLQGTSVQHNNIGLGGVLGEECGTLQRRPTRPAPPPPQLPGLPGSAMHNIPLYDDGTLIDDDIICEPIPEAPPSPEPVRKQHPDQPRSIYVDPLAFLQKPFLRLSIALSGKDANKTTEGTRGDEDEPDALYSRVKDFVMSKVRKTGSIVSLNRMSEGVSNNPDGTGRNSSPTKSKYGKTGSLASLHDITESELDKNYSGSKRSMSLASLNMHDSTLQSHVGPSGNPSRHASRHSIADEDVPPHQRDEYIDLEEMARKMAARAAQQQQQQHNIQGSSGMSGPSSNGTTSPAPTQPLHVVTSQPLSVHALQQQSMEHPLNTSVGGYPPSQVSPSEDRTPDFIPASAYSKPPAASADRVQDQHRNTPSTSSGYEIGPSVLYPNQQQQQAVPTVSGSFDAHNPHHQQQQQLLQQQPPTSRTAFLQSNYNNFNQNPPAAPAQSYQNTAALPSKSPVPAAATDAGGGRPAVPSRPSAQPSTPSPGTAGTVVPYTGAGLPPHQPHQLHHKTSSVSNTPNGTLGRSKPSVPPRPSVLTENPSYKSLGRPIVGPPSPKLIDPRRTTAAAPTGGLPGSPLIAPKPSTLGPAAAMTLHEQQLLQQQMIQQQQLQQMYLQQNPAAMHQLLLQQQMQQEHTIMTPAVQQQLLQEQQMIQQMLQHQQQYQLHQQYQQHLQQQLIQQQLQHGMRYRQPLSSTSSTGSSGSSQSSRSHTTTLHKPNHPPPPPPTQHHNSSTSNNGIIISPIESSI